MAITQEDRELKLTTPLGDDFLLIQRMVAHEGLSQLFRYEMELLHEETEPGDEPTMVDPQDIIGQPVTVRIQQQDGTERFWNGIVIQFSPGQRDEEYSYYRAIVVPQVWLLTQNVQSQIFQQLSVRDILKKFLEGFNFADQLQGTYEPRNYCVQYRESDFDFISRLMEEEGIYYFFEHQDGQHKLILADTPQSHADCPSKHEVEFSLEVEQSDGFRSSIETWYVDYNLRTGKYTLWDYNFELPKKNLEAVQPTRFKIGGNDNLELYDYPGGYAKRFDGVNKGGNEQGSELNKIFEDNKRTVTLRMQELDSQYKRIKGSSDCASLTAGYRFTLENHPAKDTNGQYTLVSVTHNMVQTPAYDTNAAVPDAYTNEFLCIPFQTPFRPPRTTPKPTVKGCQTAFVVGPPGEEIFTDKYGRVKVQFNWDRDSQADNTSSCWIRVAQAWAGNRWGTMFIPRVGFEVIVDFLEGDPDQPIITGCVYNAESMPPYDLPDKKTKMTIKSNSTKDAKGFNELRFEDEKEHEQIFIHAQKDVDFRVKNDEREWVGNDHHFIIKKNRHEKIEQHEYRYIEQDQYEQIHRDLHLTIDGDDRTKIGGSLSLKVGGDVGEKFGGNHSEETGGAIYLKAGSTIVLEAPAGITLKCGGNFVAVTPAGVDIQGSMVKINSGGSAGSGQAVTIAEPKKPEKTDEADDDKPGTKMNLEKRSQARKERTFKPNEEDEKTKHWIKVKLVDEAGKPVPGEVCKITLPDGRVTSRSTNQKGEVHVKGIKDAGSCQITFPNLDKDAWEEA